MHFKNMDLNTFPKNDVILFSGTFLCCRVKVIVRVTVRVKIRVSVSENTIKIVFGQTSILASVLDPEV